MSSVNNIVKKHLENANLKENNFPPSEVYSEIDYNDQFANPYCAARFGYIDDVIEPRNTRARIIRAFEMLQTKRLTNPLKKHSNIPL